MFPPLDSARETCSTERKAPTTTSTSTSIIEKEATMTLYQMNEKHRNHDTTTNVVENDDDVRCNGSLGKFLFPSPILERLKSTSLRTYLFIYLKKYVHRYLSTVLSPCFVGETDRTLKSRGSCDPSTVPV